MRTPLAALCVSLSLLGGAALAQTPSTPPPQPTAKPPAPPAGQPPATPKPRPRAPAAPSTASVTVTLTVTDGVGAPLDAVDVTATGPLDRGGTTDANGTLRLQGLRVGTYRFRFDREGYVAFEREVTTQAAQKMQDVAITLTAAPAPPSPPAPSAPPPKAPEQNVPASADPKTLMLTEWLEKNFINNREPQKVSSIGCTGLSEAVVWQVREPWTERRNEDADSMLYVVGGEGTLRLDERDVSIEAGSFAVVPRGTRYSLTRRGRNPLIVLAVLSGAAC